MSDDNDAFDKDEALEIIQDDEEFLKELVEMFITDLPEQISRIKGAVDGRDSEALRKSAHDLKGAVANFGKRAVFKTALELEMMGKENKLDDAEKTYSALVKNIEHLEKALRVFIESE
jgi:HPt (histidine-containing phosphotransfer) domain-containing protein